MLAAPILLDLSREGRLGCDVWLVHLTGEEFPSDCLGARALSSTAGRRDAEAAPADGKTRDLSRVQVRGVYVMDMIAHNNDRDRDVFQMSPGVGAPSLWLARQAADRRRNLERVGPGVEPASRRAAAGVAASAADDRQAKSRRSPPIPRCSARCGRRQTRTARCTTPTARSSPTPACRSCSSWRTTTSIGRDTTTRTTRWRTSTSITGRRWRPSPSKSAARAATEKPPR